ncbi:MAG: TVP38/TMEM64 family protein [Clostridiales bacterium]|nr:TVP38/TMEM64 family protein [Clostridiales bacterium]
MAKIKNKDKIYDVVKYVPFVITLVVVILSILLFRNTTFGDVVNFTPDNLWLAALVIFAMFAVKSLSIVIPLTIMFIASGIIFPFPVALIVSFIGLVICFTPTYFVGRVSGAGLVKKLTKKFPKIEKLHNLGVSNNIFTSFLTRAVVFVPGDVVSMLLGAIGIKYVPYIIGSAIGVMPELVFQVAIGYYLDQEISLKMIIMLIVMIVASFLISFIINKLLKKRFH